VSTVDEIKQAIERLPKTEFWRLSEWVIRKHDDEWGRQIEQDIRAGKLDKLAEEAVDEYKAGKTRPFPE
jgi:hypothetical protein